MNVTEWHAFEAFGHQSVGAGNFIVFLAFTAVLSRHMTYFC